MAATVVFPPSAHDIRHGSEPPGNERDVTHYRLRWGASNPPVENEAEYATFSLPFEGGAYRVSLPTAYPGHYVSVEARDASGHYSPTPRVGRVPTTNTPPVPLSPLPPVVGVEGDDEVTIDLRTYFADADEDLLTFTLGAPTAGVRVEGHLLIVSREAAQSSSVEVVAADPAGAQTALTLDVAVAPYTLPEAALTAPGTLYTDTPVTLTVEVTPGAVALASVTLAREVEDAWEEIAALPPPGASSTGASSTLTHVWTPVAGTTALRVRAHDVRGGYGEDAVPVTTVVPEPPSVTFESIGATFEAGQIILLQARAEAGTRQVHRVAFAYYAGGLWHAVDTDYEADQTGSLYETSWFAVYGAERLRATVYDTAGLSASAEVNITVEQANTAPPVPEELTFAFAPPAVPVLLAEAASSTEISITASLPEGAVGVEIDFSEDGGQIWQRLAGSPFEGPVAHEHAGREPETTYVYRARSYDDVPAYSAYAEQEVTTPEPENAPPTVTLGSYPETITEGEPLEVLFAIEDDQPAITAGITATAEPAGGAPIAASLVTTTSATWHGLAPGTYTITVTYTDEGGLSDADTGEVLVEAPVNAPPVVAVTSAPGAEEGAELSVYFTVEDDQPVVVGGITAVLAPGNLPATSITWNGSVWTALWEAAPAAGVYTASVTYTDAGGLSASDEIDVTVDAAGPPPITLLLPGDGATLAAGEPITLQAEGAGNPVEFYAVKVA